VLQHVDEPHAGFEAAHTTVLQPEVKLSWHQPEDVNEVSEREERGANGEPMRQTGHTLPDTYARVEVIIITD
jgi:hypothetical protein